MQPLFLVMRNSKGSIRTLVSRKDISLEVYSGDKNSSKQAGEIYVSMTHGNKKILIQVRDSKGTPITDCQLDVPNH